MLEYLDVMPTFPWNGEMFHENHDIGWIMMDMCFHVFSKEKTISTTLIFRG